MSRSISEPIEPKEEKPEISNAELMDLGMAIFFSLEEMHAKMDSILNQMDIEKPVNTGETPEN